MAKLETARNFQIAVILGSKVGKNHSLLKCEISQHSSESIVAIGFIQVKFSLQGSSFSPLKFCIYHMASGR